jgi:hypothetical protein
MKSNRPSRLLCAALTCLAAQAASAGVIWSGNGHEYQLVIADGIAWSGANSAAAALGGGWHLATATSATENAFLVSLLPSSVGDRDHYWLGGSDAAAEGIWTWVTGETFTYTNWWGNEPNGGGSENYLAMDARGTTYAWNDATNALGPGYVRGYLLERPLPLPGTLPLAALAGLVAVAAHRVAGRRA